jgi:hypothetical protein
MASATASSNTKDSIESGARTFDSTAAAQCQAVLGTMTCDQLQDVLSGVGLCSSVTVPSALPGARCYNPYDCVGGNLYCTGPDCSQVCSDHYGSVPPGQVCDTIHPCDETLGSCHWIYPADGGIVAGTCVAYLAVGQSCWGTSGAECGTSSYCDDQGTCRARLDVGAACEQYRYQCKTGLYCAPLPGDAGYSGTCAAQVGSGSACFAWDACANGLNCNMTAHLCMPWFPTAGQPCTLDNSCYPYPPGLYCKGAVGTTPGVCSMATKVGSGQACATADPKDKVCTPGLRCDLQSATCLALLGNGQGPCTDNSDCKMLESCVKQVTDAGYAPTGTCQYAVTAGNGCPGLVDCLGPSFCDSATQTCVAPQPDGHACTGDSECANGNCFSNVCVAACVVP